LTDHRVDTAVIWFSDVSDFSGIVLKLSPVRAADLIQQFFNVQAEAIHHHGGHIDKFMGDGLMAFWILPQDTSAARQRICEEVADAAMAAATAVGELHLGARALKLRIGLHVGQVLSGDFGSATRHQFTLIGAEVNKAARLEQATSDDLVEKNMKISNVRVSEGYYSALSDPYKARFPNKACLRARNIGDLALYS
jgi:class 3 adenylate cyclase